MWLRVVAISHQRATLIKREGFGLHIKCLGVIVNMCFFKSKCYHSIPYSSPQSPKDYISPTSYELPEQYRIIRRSGIIPIDTEGTLNGPDEISLNCRHGAMLSWKLGIVWSVAALFVTFRGVGQLYWLSASSTEKTAERMFVYRSRCQ
jgi:hypothetical protein